MDALGLVDQKKIYMNSVWTLDAVSLDGIQCPHKTDVMSSSLLRQ